MILSYTPPTPPGHDMKQSYGQGATSYLIGPKEYHSWVHFHKCEGTGMHLEIPTASRGTRTCDVASLLYIIPFDLARRSCWNVQQYPQEGPKKTGLSTRYLLAPCRKSRKITKLFYRVGPNLVCTLEIIWAIKKIRYLLLYIYRTTCLPFSFQNLLSAK